METKRDISLPTEMQGLNEEAEISRSEPEKKGILSLKQKAALIIVSLGADRASELYKFMSEQDIEELTCEVARIGRVNNDDIEEALSEFNRMCVTHRMMTDGGMNYAKAVLEKAFGEVTARNLLDKVSKSLSPRPFSFLSKSDSKKLNELLKTERPQVIALIMSYLDPQQAAEALQNLSEEKRIPTVRAMANMDRVSPEAIAIVEDEMKKKFANVISSDIDQNLGGVEFVADIMNRVDRSAEKKMFEEMEMSDPLLAKDIRERMFVFEDIMTMDTRSVQRFIRDLESKDIVYALKTASDEMKELFLNNMSKRQAEAVNADMEILSGVRLKEVEEAQQRIVNVIRRLEAQGEVIISKGGGEDTII